MIMLCLNIADIVVKHLIGGVKMTKEECEKALDTMYREVEKHERNSMYDI